jgi:peptidyl-prolyl cis-trans isomerase SurA
MEDLQKAAEQEGVSYEDFKQKIKDQIVTQQVIGREVGQRLQPTAEEEHKFYDEHKNELAQPETIRLSELMISTEKASGDDQLAAAKAKADDLLGQIKRGASFEDLAKANSNGPSAAQGGDLGYFKRGTLAKQLEDTTFAMKAGEVSNVIHTKQGFVILKVTEHHDGGIPPFKEIEPRVMDAVYMEKLQPALRTYLEQLRVEAYIKVYPGYVDSAASPNETEPVETNTSDPNAKKLKKKKKLGII